MELTTADMTGLFGMLDADKIDTIANQVEVNDKRREKYQFSQPIFIPGRSWLPAVMMSLLTALPI